MGVRLSKPANADRRVTSPPISPALLRDSQRRSWWKAYFRTLKSESIWHRIEQRVDAHSLITFLGYCLWICLERRLKAAATSLTPALILHSLKQILLLEVWFDLRKGGRICLPSITQPEKEQLLILHHLGWSLLEQPPGGKRVNCRGRSNQAWAAAYARSVKQFEAGVEVDLN